MAERVTPRPKLFPPPEFPPRRPARFARMPPAVFSVLLGLVVVCGLLPLADVRAALQQLQRRRGGSARV